GGDEFAVILPGAHDAAVAVARRLVDSLNIPFSIGDRNIDLRASIGVSTFPDQAELASDLVQNADLALYAAKRAGLSTVRAFTPSLRAEAQRQVSMLREARTALDRGWIEPFYQPKIALETGRVAGFEALLRWRHPNAGLQLPATIASAFDDTELAEHLGEAMVEAVLADIRLWLDCGVGPGKVAINASAAEFRKPGYAERLLERVWAHGVPANLLELEITETAFLGDSAENVLFALQMLRTAGMTIALDDFGTGFSSLSHLRSLPVDTIKIDRSFVAGLVDCAEDRAIVEAVLRLGEALGMTTVAEGVETQAQAEYLRLHGCTIAQGFLYAPAVAATEAPSAYEADYS
ncbi:MAG: bifunctional diguanylate cyclase/phosphodiesterase, partial [Devosia sp.]